MKRLDSLLCEGGYFESRSKAQAALEEGLVAINGKIVTKSTQKYTQEEFQTLKIEITQGKANRYVSRGGLKLEGAVQHTRCEIVDKIVLDVGISTGGFTDFLLQSKAKLVVGIDVGTNQIHASLKQHPQLKVFENTNIKDVDGNYLKKKNLPQEFDLVVGDVSFISSTLVFPFIQKLLETNGKILFLIKPQFELDAKKLSKKGIVKDPENYLVVESKIKNKMIELGFKVLDYFESSITGGDGNKEFFIYAAKESNTLK